MMNSSPFFSVIIPVYNVEQYLDECVQSVLGQTFRNFEIILVDDGSTDSSGALCDELQLKDARIKVIHKENGGLSSARNVGIDNSEGVYIFFIDSDDYLSENNAFEGIYGQLCETNADVIMYRITKYFQNEDKYEPENSIHVDVSRIRNQSKEDAVVYMLKNNLYRADACAKIIKRDLVLKNKMRFIDGVLSEDMDWCGDILLYANSYDYYDSFIYIYRLQRQGSITFTNSDKLVVDKIKLCKIGLSKLEKMPIEKYKHILGSYYAYEYSVCLGISRSVKNRELLTEMKNMSPILKYDISHKVKKVNKCINVMGYTLTRYLLCVFVWLKN